jgi:putative ABC transport system permease protein
MFLYYVRIGLLGLRRQPVLSALMVLAIAVGVATAMTALTILHRLGADPAPGRSDIVHAIAVDNWSPDRSWGERRGVAVAPEQLTWKDAKAIHEQTARVPGATSAIMFRVSQTVQPERGELRPFQASVRATTPEFFALFGVDFAAGGAWSAADEASAARQAVLSKPFAERLFGTEPAVGKRVQLGGEFYTVSGVLRDWRPRPKFYDLTTGAMNDPEQIYIPLSVAMEKEIPSNGNVNCYESPGEGFASFLASECIWVQGWVALPDAATAAAWGAMLDGYVAEQRAAGRSFKRASLTRAVPLREWLELRGVVPDDARLFTVLGFAFLLVCLLNAGTLLLAKFLRRSGEIGLRRAVGASRRALFLQYVTESAVVGVLGAVAGVLLTLGGLAGVRTLSPTIESAARLDPVMLLACVVVALGTSVLAGVYPAWRAASIAPAAQLKIN